MIDVELYFYGGKNINIGGVPVGSVYILQNSKKRTVIGNSV